MTRSYYYFAASLPIIDWGGKIPMATADFLTDAQRLLADDDYRLMEQLLTSDDSMSEPNNMVASSWIQFNRNLRNEQAWFRAYRLHQDPNKFVHGAKENEFLLREAVLQASKMTNLLEA